MLNIIKLIFFTTFLTAGLADLLTFVHVCHKDDPNLDKCMIAACEDLRPYLVTGVPEMKIPSLEPLILHDLISEEVAGMKIVTSNVTTYGSSDYFVRKLSVNMEERTFELHLDLPKLIIEAHYNVDGKILLLPVKGSGEMEANITECHAVALLKCELYEKNGEMYIKFVSNKLDVSVGGGHVDIKSLFNGDRILLGMINDVINKNLMMFLKELLPVIERTLSDVILDIANRIVEPYTFKQLFPH